MGFLDKGSVLRHKHLGYVVRITDIQRGNYVLGWVERQETRFTDILLQGPWSASDLVRDFCPQIQASRWDRLLDGGTILSEDAHPQE